MTRVVTPQDPLNITASQQTFDDVIIRGGFIILENVAATITFQKLKKQ